MRLFDLYFPCILAETLALVSSAQSIHAVLPCVLVFGSRALQVSKAMGDQRACAAAGEATGAAHHARRVELFTQQLVEANPILTELSACMTGEGRALGGGDLARAASFTARKAAANAALQACSQKYNAAMKAHRESYKAP